MESEGRYYVFSRSATIEFCCIVLIGIYTGVHLKGDFDTSDWSTWFRFVIILWTLLDIWIAGYGLYHEIIYWISFSKRTYFIGICVNMLFIIFGM